jgi:hypothetical protein
VSDFVARFEPPAGANETLLSRTHPVVSGMAKYVLDTALDDRVPGVASRAGVMRTASVTTRTVLLLVRYRFHLSTGDPTSVGHQLLAEDSGLLAFTGEVDIPAWLELAEAESLLAARPSGNVSAEQAVEVLDEVLVHSDGWLAGVTEDAHSRAAALLEDHRRVRLSSQRRVRGLAVEPQLPADVIGCYVLLPS